MKKIYDQDHTKYITTQEFNKLTSDNLTARLKQANLGIKNDFANFVKKKDFHDKLKSSNEKVTWNKTKHVLVENILDKLSKKVEVVSTKGLAKDLLNKYTILNGAKCFSSGIVQNYSAFISTKNVLGFLLAQLKLIFGNIVEFQKKLLKI